LGGIRKVLERENVQIFQNYSDFENTLRFHLALCLLTCKI